MVVETGQVVDRRLPLHDREEAVALERERDLLCGRRDEVHVAVRERSAFGCDGDDAVHVRPEAERGHAELTHAEARLATRRRGTEHDRAASEVTVPLAERSV